MGVSTFGNPRIEAYLQLPAAYRSLSRPSSAPDAKAFTLRSYSLELLSFNIWFSIFELSEFLLNISFRDYIVRIEKVSLSFVHFFHLSVKLFFYPLLLERPIISYLSSISVRFYSFSSLYSIFNEHKFVNPLGSTWSVWMDSNHRPRAYQARALTT